MLTAIPNTGFLNILYLAGEIESLTYTLGVIEPFHPPLLQHALPDGLARPLVCLPLWGFQISMDLALKYASAVGVPEVELVTAFLQSLTPDPTGM